jgi:hypothetical protein
LMLMHDLPFAIEPAKSKQWRAPTHRSFRYRFSFR